MFHQVPVEFRKPNADLPVDADHPFVTPTKLIKSMADMPIWEKSEAYYEYVGFVIAMNEAAKGKSNKVEGVELSEIVQKTMEMLDKLDAMIDEFPPIQQPQRFGNQAFRTWITEVEKQMFELLHDVLPENFHRAVPEIQMYFGDGFGNKTRIDYGTGHEMSFVMFLCCMFKIGAFVEDDKVAVVCKIFARYLELVRKLQTVYRMEPAGSHGVWSLDDYQFVPFIWGSAQLIGHPRIEPTSFLKQTIVDTYAKDYLFMGCIQYINKVKSGPFAEHSNQLWSISGVSTWGKINSGLIKMYKAEVLSKFPVVQHIYFGSLLSLKSAETNASVPKPRIHDSTAPIRPKTDEQISNVSSQ